MKHSRESSFWARVFVVPAVVGLVSASVIAGYAREAMHQDETRSLAYMPKGLTLLLTGNLGQQKDDDAFSDPLQNYQSVLALLKKEYYGPAIDGKKTRALTYDAIRGMLDSLKDDYTSFLDPDDWSQMQTLNKGDFEGIGALLTQDPTTMEIKIVRPIETGPAEKVGLRKDDIIASVNGKSIIGKDINLVISQIKGKRGTQVRIGIVRAKKPIEFTITRALVEPPVVKAWMEDKQNGIGHVVLLDSFNEKTMPQMEKKLAELQKQGLKALVLDLRSNPGGLLNVAVDVVSSFIARDSAEAKELENAVVFVREGSGKEMAIRLRPSGRDVVRVPMVVLTNDMSASASEIVAGAIKDYGRGTIIGERTFGKGLVQTLFPLDDRSALKITTAKYYTPRRNDINRKRDEEGNSIANSGGIVPQIEVKQSEKWKSEDFDDKEHDTQLQKALEFLKARLGGMTVAQAIKQVQQPR